MDTIIIDGNNLSLEQVHKIAIQGAQAKLPNTPEFLKESNQQEIFRAIY